MRAPTLLAILLLAACGGPAAPTRRDDVGMSAAAPAPTQVMAAGPVQAEAAITGLIPADLAMCFVEPGRPATLRWSTAARVADGGAPFVIRDYAGRQVDAGSAQVDAAGAVTIARTFARGWYEIEFPAARQAFGVVALEAQPGGRDPFFCMDSALSWLETDPARRDGLVRILARCGIAMSRERLGLGSINPSPGVYTWEHPQRRYDSLRALYAAQGVPILEMLHGGGRHHEVVKDVWFPSDYPRLAESNLAQTAHWGAGWGGVEIENEPDLHGLPAEQYVGVVKAASWAHLQSGSAVPLVAGVFGGIPPGPYFDACAANGMLADCDAVSFHSYDRADSVEAMVARYRVWLAASGREALPLWHSECGWPWVKGPDRAPAAQDADSAVEIAFKGVESRVCGVARYFPFVYVHYEEGPKCFGMMGRDGTPLRSMAAYAASVAVLSGARYAGDLQGVDGPARLARVFARDGDPQCVVALYAGAP
ncbi:MAG: hypothetical protein J0M02_15725, partial [Planctomycetes bacterium]|nr:hypothetical protein [Planctomycetota bacterium]